MSSYQNIGEHTDIKSTHKLLQNVAELKYLKITVKIKNAVTIKFWKDMLLSNSENFVLQSHILKNLY